MPRLARDQKQKDSSGPDKPPAHTPGETSSKREGEPVARTPNERDESASSQGGAPNPVMKQAHDDVERGLVDTGRSTESEKIYRRYLRPAPKGAEPGAAKDAEPAAQRPPPARKR